MAARADNFLLFRIGPAFRASSGLSIDTERVLYLTLLAFLREHHLADANRLDALGELHDGYELRSLDVTDEGLEFFRTGVERWYAALDRGRAPTDTSILAKYLAKMRGSHAS